MNTLARTRHAISARSRVDRGITTVELLVGMVITALIGAFALTFFVVSTGTSSAQIARQQQEAASLDAVNRISRDVTFASPIIMASSTDLILRTSTGPSQQSAVRYSVQGGNLVTWTIVNPINFPGTPTDPAWTAGTATTVVSRLVANVTSAAPGGAPVFTYTDRTGVLIPIPNEGPTTDPAKPVGLTRAAGGTAKIGWVNIDVFSQTRDRKGVPIELTGKARASSEAPIGVCIAPATP